MAQHLCIQGPLGSGKTFLASVLAHHWRNMVRRKGGDIQLFSNYGLQDAHMMEHYKDWYDVARAQGSIAVWDEAHINFDSRTSLKSENIIATQLLIYTRKMKSIQFYCTPSVLNLDSRLRQIIEVLINVRKQGNKGIAIDFFDYQAKQFGTNGKFLHTQFISKSYMLKVFKLNLFDTDQMVAGFPMPKTERLANDFFTNLEEIHNEYRKKRSVFND